MSSSSRTGAPRVVEQPDPVAEQHRRDVRVDLVDQSALEELPADRGREDLEVLAAGGLQPDPERPGHIARPPSTAPVVSAYSSTRPARNENPVIQSIAWFGPATYPSSDIVKCQSTLPPAVCRSVSATGGVNVVSMLGGVSAVDMIDPLSLHLLSSGRNRSLSRVATRRRLTPRHGAAGRAVSAGRPG